MQALVWQGGQQYALEDIPRPRAEAGRIVVKVEATAVCGSDFHLEDFGATPPLIPGHEVAGTVVETGQGVTCCAVGDRVALDPVQTCGTCWCCMNGCRHLCRNYRHLGVGNTPGSWAAYVAIDAANAHRIPDTLDLASACLAEPAAVCYESFQRAGLRTGDRVLILGDGPFGFLHAQVARALQAGNIVIAGHYDQRLQRIAAATGAIVCNTNRQSLTDLLATDLGSNGVDVAIEASGSGASPNIAIQALRPRGTLVIFSYIWKPQPLEMGLIHMRELNVLGSCRSLDAYPACLALMAQRRIRPDLLIDLKLPLGDYASAQTALQTRKAEVFKVVFCPQPE